MAEQPACTHGGIELKAYEYFARVVLLLCGKLAHAKTGAQRLDTELQHLA